MIRSPADPAISVISSDACGERPETEYSMMQVSNFQIAPSRSSYTISTASYQVSEPSFSHLGGSITRGQEYMTSLSQPEGLINISGRHHISSSTPLAAQEYEHLSNSYASPVCTMDMTLVQLSSSGLRYTAHRWPLSLFCTIEGID
jgi:hypothetical protein